MTGTKPIDAVAMNRSFFQRSAPLVAQELLGKVLVHQTPQGPCGGIIVETEAYDESDPASHSCHGQTKRNQMMFGAGATSYVYRCYGAHWCFNISVGKVGYGAAVLIRAIEPSIGIEEMLKRRRASLSNCGIRDIARGPGRLCQAMGIDFSHNGLDLLEEPLTVSSPKGFRRPESIASPRIGISKAINVPWRFYVRNNSFVSSPK